MRASSTRSSSSLPGGGDGPIKNFVKIHSLPVEGIFVTNDYPKMPLLRKLGVVKHYDDNPDMMDDMLPTDTMEFILVSNGKILKRINGTKNSR